MMPLTVGGSSHVTKAIPYRLHKDKPNQEFPHRCAWKLAYDLILDLIKFTFSPMHFSLQKTTRKSNRTRTHLNFNCIHCFSCQFLKYHVREEPDWHESSMAKLWWDNKQHAIWDQKSCLSFSNVLVCGHILGLGGIHTTWLDCLLFKNRHAVYVNWVS